MKRRTRGRGLTVSETGPGWIGMSDFCGNRDGSESARTIHRALDLGIEFPDPADMTTANR